MSAATEFQTAIYNELLASDDLRALVGDRIFDGVPSDADYPCVTFGPAYETDQNAECITASEQTIQVDVWSRDQGKKWPCKEIVSAVKDALHDVHMTIADPYAVSSAYVRLARVMDDPDGTTAHGVLTVSAVVTKVNG